MPSLDSSLNDPANWEQLQRVNKRRVEVDLQEVERVIELARRTPSLSEYETGLHELSRFFEVATQFYRQSAPDDLVGLVAFWERYRAAVIQRYTAITPVEVRAADKVVQNIFERFLNNIPNERIAYAPDARPLVYGGEGGLGAYFTHPPGWNRPFAIINLPHAAFDNVWQWLALPHETGHDLYATVDGLAPELEDVIAQRMTTAAGNGTLDIPDVDVDLSPFGVPYRIQYSGAEFIATVWRGWANEAQADIVGLLACGAAAAAALQQIIEFSAEDRWDIFRTPEGGIGDGPEPHPTSYIRNILNIEALRKIDAAHGGLANEIQGRFDALRPEANAITWHLGDTIKVAEVPVQEMRKSAEIAAEVLVDHSFAALGDKSYAQISKFDAHDQEIVDAMVDPLIDGDPLFIQQQGAEPRHALASTLFAFERSRDTADIINRTFKHFV